MMDLNNIEHSTMLNIKINNTTKPLQLKLDIFIFTRFNGLKYIVITCQCVSPSLPGDYRENYFNLEKEYPYSLDGARMALNIYLDILIKFDGVEHKSVGRVLQELRNIEDWKSY